MKDEVKRTEVLSVVKDAGLRKEIRASHELSLAILTPSETLAWSSRLIRSERKKERK